MNALHRSIAALLAPVLLVAGALFSSCATVPTVPSGVRSELAPSGKLRAAINFGNPVLAQKDPATGEPSGGVGGPGAGVGPAPGRSCRARHLLRRRQSV